MPPVTATFELEMERKKIELKFQKKKRACELKFQIQIAEKEAKLLKDDRSDSNSQRGLGGKSGFLSFYRQRLRNGERAVPIRIKKPNTTLTRAGKKNHKPAGRNNVFPYFVNSTETGSCLYPSRVSDLRKHGDLVFHGRDAFPSCFRVRNERSCFHHISVITFAFFLVSVTFQVTLFFFFFNPCPISHD